MDPEEVDDSLAIGQEKATIMMIGLYNRLSVYYLILMGDYCGYSHLDQPIEVKRRGLLESLRLTFKLKQPQRPSNRRPSKVHCPCSGLFLHARNDGAD